MQGIIILITSVVLSFFVIKAIYFYENKRVDEIMIVTIDLKKKTIECVDWISKKIHPFCGEFSLEMIEKIKPYCRKNEDYPPVPTRIYIYDEWGRNLAYNEPIKNYLENPNLIYSGQGYHYGSGKRWETRNEKKCEQCGQTIKN